MTDRNNCEVLHLILFVYKSLAGIESSVRSIFSKPLTSAVYAISMIVGAVAMLAFYESPGNTFLAFNILY